MPAIASNHQQNDFHGNPCCVASAKDQGPEAQARGLVSAGEAGLGNNADFVSPPPVEVLALPPPSTVKGWYLRSVGRDLMKQSGLNRRMRWCGSRITRGLDGVGLYARPTRAYGRVHGVCVCGQSICCPVCAPRIASHRAAEVAEGFNRAANAGWEARLETFTKPHRLNPSPDALAQEVEAFANVWRTFQTGKKADKRDRGAIGNQTAREITFGARNGWHYHHHRLRFDLPGTFDPERARAHWISALRCHGFDCEGIAEHSYHCAAVGSEAGARYVAKVTQSVEASARAIGSEVASAATKGRNINQLLHDYAKGDQPAGVTWINGVTVVTGKKISSVRWSPGLRDKLGLGVGRSDEAIAQEEATPADVFLGALNPMQWRGVLQWRAEFALCVAANKGVDAVNEFLAGLELGQLNDDAPGAVFTPDSGEFKEPKIKSC